jgi:hypothetical protein
MIDRLEAWLKHTPITGKRCGKGMYLPIIVLRSRTARSIGRLTGGRQTRDRNAWGTLPYAACLYHEVSVVSEDLRPLAHGLRR